MNFQTDIARINQIVAEDPAFRSVDSPKLREQMQAMQTAQQPEDFILAAMRVLALPGNGHTRLIPNRAVHVLPLRFVAWGTKIVLTETATETDAPIGKSLTTVNGKPVEQILSRAAPYLAGTPARQRVIGAICFAWPAALRTLGVPLHDSIEYGFGAKTWDVPVSATVPASLLYPQNEHGQALAAWTPGTYADINDWPGAGVSIRLPSFFEAGDTGELDKAIQSSAEALQSRKGLPLLVDVRGNTGGDFLKTMPLIDAIASHARDAHCTVLVDKFTFSAAIVFVALLKHRLQGALSVVGEDMGDGLRFFAEGGLKDLPDCGAVVRYSSALHDWDRGVIDKTTPANIAAQIVGVGTLTIEHHEPLPSLTEPKFEYPALLRRML